MFKLPYFESIGGPKEINVRLNKSKNLIIFNIVLYRNFNLVVNNMGDVIEALRTGKI